MKSLAYLLVVICTTTSLFATTPKTELEPPAMGTIPFITTWKTNNQGTSANNQITIPTEGIGYNYAVDWGDGNSDTNITGDITHTYATPGTYTVSIEGDFPRIYFNNGGDRQKILTIEQWGDNLWTSMASAFKGCMWMQGNFTDAPNLSMVTDMSEMFSGTPVFNYPIGDWDVSTVTNMREMFRGSRRFNQDIGAWNTSNVTNMKNMFAVASAFNQNIGSWNVSNVTDFNSMFYAANTFNQDIGLWNTSSATNMVNMFGNASAFNQNIDFKIGAGIPAGTDAWNVSMVENFEYMFFQATSFNQDIGSWDVSRATNMRSMFTGPSAFNQDIGGWNVSNVTTMSAMFALNTTFNQDIGSWNVANVTDMTSMFNRATAFNQDIGGWTTTSLNSTFNMFIGATNFDQDISGWNVTGVTTMQNMFRDVTLSTANYDAILNGWNAQNLQPNVNFHGGYSQYCDGAAARANMIASDNWSIPDGGPAAGSTVNELVDQTHANSYTLPVITGTNLTGSEQYYTGANGTGTAYAAGSTINFTDFATYPVTFYIYDGAGSCTSEESFELTLTSTCTPPTADSLPNVSECTNYTLPALSANNEYYTATNKGGTQLNPGDIVSTTQTIFVYAETGTAPNTCSDENSFTITITGSPTADSPTDVTACGSYILPALSANNKYFTAANGGGTRLNAGDMVSVTQQLYIYMEIGTAPNTCSDENVFDITINARPVVDNIPDVFECDSYTLPALSVNNNYYTATNAEGTLLNAGDLITTSQTIYIYTATGIAPNTCSNEDTFNITIYGNQMADSPMDVSVCESYTLPALSSSNNYYTATNGEGTLLAAGDTITTTQTLFVYTETNGCSDENSFTITINSPIAADIIDTVTVCENFVLPVLNSGRYYTETLGAGTELFAGDIVASTQTIFIYTESETCFDETNFTITIDPNTCEQPVDNTTCKIEFPKFFTPNGDGINDRFELLQNDCNSTGELRIYDRYGKLIFQTNDLSRSWDGTFGGKDLPPSDYWCQIIDSDGQLVTKHFALKR